VDSVEARRAALAFGPGGLEAMAQQVGRDWTTLSIRVLTGGYSGAFVVEVRGNQAGTQRAVVCKAARDEKGLRDEVDSWRKAAESYAGVFGLLPPLVDTNLHAVQMARTECMWYMVQALVPGSTLEDELLAAVGNGGGGKDAFAGVVEGLIARLERATEAGIEGGCSTESSSDALSVSAANAARLRADARSLAVFCERVAERDATAAARLPRAPKIQEFCEFVAEKWNAALVACGLDSVPFYEQHGDLHARNVLIPNAGSALLIDFARYRKWPVAFDLVRLQLSVFLRCVDTRDRSDAFVDRLATWLALRADRDALDGPVLGWEQAYAWLAWRLGMLQTRACRLAEAKCRFVGATRVLHAVRALEALRGAVNEEASWFKRLYLLTLAMEDAKSCGIWAGSA